MIELVFATNNAGKILEIREIVSGYKDQATVKSLNDMGVHLDVVEDGETYEDNAMKKAREAMLLTNRIALADDSGLEVDFLDKQPGVFSARYLGENTHYDIKNNHILSLLKDVQPEKRTARFVCVIAAAFPEEYGSKTLVTRATIEGIIAESIMGENGFGYDPILFVPEYGMTTAQMPMNLKNSISHRGRALRMMLDKIIN